MVREVGGRQVAVAVALAGAVAFVVIAVVLVPWDPIPGGPLHPPSASSVFTAAEIDRAEGFASLARVWSWCSLAVSLLLACVLGFTRLGSAFVDRLRGPWWVRLFAAVLALALAGRLVTLPFAILLRRRVLDYGLSHQAWGAFAVDLAKGLAVNVIGTSIALATLVASPVENGISRRIETRADVNALEATHDPAAFIEVQKELARRSLGDPTPPAWSQFWFGSHPTTLQRIALAKRFDG